METIAYSDVPLFSGTIISKKKKKKKTYSGNINWPCSLLKHVQPAAWMAVFV
jgi:hypothetical protein